MRKFCYIAMLAMLCLGSCASLSGYPWYIIDPVTMKLLADKPQDNLPLLETCKETPFDKAKCIAMLREDYFKMEKELLQLRQALKDCQNGH